MKARFPLVTLLVLAAVAVPGLATPASDAEKERLLLEGAIVGTGQPPGGRSKSVWATVRLDGVEHRAMVHTLDEWKASFKLVDRTELDFRDSYKNNIAAYRLDRLLGLGMVPVTVLRNHKSQPASFMWWLEDMKMDEAERLELDIRSPDPGSWARQMYTVRIFDQLIYNTDRNAHNLLIDDQWRIWMIDHTRAFKVFGECQNPEQLGQRCSRGMLEALRGLDEESLAETMKDVLSPDQVKGLLGRRDAIVAHFDDLLSKKPETLVLFDAPPRDEAATH